MARNALEPEEEDVLSLDERLPQGSMRWTAPEQLHLDIPTNFKTDIWSVGMLILEVITGERPYASFRGEPRLSLVIWNEDLRPERPLRCVWLSDALWQLMKECWAKDPNQRPDITDVCRRLQEVAEAFVPPAQWSSELGIARGVDILARYT
jgi:son of sevenless